MHVMKAQRCKNALERLRTQLKSGNKIAKVEETTTETIITGYTHLRGVKIPVKETLTRTVNSPEIIVGRPLVRI